MNIIKKSKLAKLPIYKTNASVVIVDSTNINKCISEISQFSYIGFDTESRPVYNSQIYQTISISLIQIATNDKVYLFHIKQVLSFQKLKDILESTKITKVGVGIENDVIMLKHIKINLITFIDLNLYIKKYTCFQGQLGVKQLTANILGNLISKSKKITMSRWDLFPMTEKQIKYAVEDASVCLDMYNKLKNK